MPYLRLYLPEIPIARKRQLARKLIDTTLRTFQLHPADRDQITIQFLTPAKVRPRPNCRVEVGCRDLPAANKRAFTENVAPLITRSLRLQSRLDWLKGGKVGPVPTVDVRFLELPFDSASPNEWAVGDALMADWNRAA